MIQPISVIISDRRKKASLAIFQPKQMPKDLWSLKRVERGFQSGYLSTGNHSDDYLLVSCITQSDLHSWSSSPVLKLQACTTVCKSTKHWEFDELWLLSMDEKGQLYMVNVHLDQQLWASITNLMCKVTFLYQVVETAFQWQHCVYCVQSFVLDPSTSKIKKKEEQKEPSRNPCFVTLR